MRLRHEDDDQDDDAVATAETMVMAWAEAVERAWSALHEINRESWQAWRNQERQAGQGWDELLDDDALSLWRAGWTAQHTVVWALHQMQQWEVRLAHEERLAKETRERRGDDDPYEALHEEPWTVYPTDERRVYLRNALEHLNTAAIPASGRFEARTGPKVKGDRPDTALKKLGGLDLTAGAWAFEKHLPRAEVFAHMKQVRERIKARACARREAKIDAAADAWSDQQVRD